jgi:excisionase family DNA binding protein
MTPALTQDSNPSTGDVDLKGSEPEQKRSYRGLQSDLPRLAYRVSEVAEMLGVSEKTVRRLIARGLLRPSKALRHHLIPRNQVEEFLSVTS